MRNSKRLLISIFSEEKLTEHSTAQSVSEELPLLSEVQRSVICYIAGCIVKKLNDKVKCEDCLIIYTGSEDQCSLTYFKSYGFLKYPSNFIIEVCQLTEQIFRLELERFGIQEILQNDAESRIISKVLTLTEFQCEHFDLYSSHKLNGIELIGGLFLKIRLYHELKKVNAKDSVRNHYRVLTHFKNM